MQNKLNIAHLVGPYVSVPPVKYGGTEQVISSLIKGLKEIGHHSILFASGDSSSVDCELVPISGQSINFAKNVEGIPQHNILVEDSKTAFHQKLKEYIKTKKIDIIHLHDPTFVDPLLINVGIPIVLTQHSIALPSEMDYFQARKDFNYVAISHNLQSATPFLNYVGMVYHGLETDQFPFVEIPDEYVCFIGRFDNEKNPHLAISLAQTLGIKIKLAGKIDHKGQKYFEEMIQPHLEDPLVEYLGELNFEDKVKLMSKSKCNIHPIAFREPFGLTVLESAYCGTPTLAFNRGSMPELIEQGRTGMVVEDVMEACSVIDECFAMRREYISERAKSLFKYQNMAKDYEAIYNKIISEYQAAKSVTETPKE
jgi:glycosyltransferase involved in cell wall biosynthesis